MESETRNIGIQRPGVSEYNKKVRVWGAGEMDGWKLMIGRLGAAFWGEEF